MKNSILFPANNYSPGNSKILFVLMFFVILIASSRVGYTQFDLAMPFLMLSPSPLHNGMGQIGTALPTDEAYSLYYNPAHLGLNSQNTNGIFQFYPSKTEWLPGFTFDDLTLSSLALNLGYQFEDVLYDATLSIGIGYMYTKLDLGENVFTDENGNVLGVTDSWENSHSLGAGFGFEYYATLSAGVTFKSARSELGPGSIQVGNETHNPNSTANMLDYGFHLFIPVLKFYSDPLKEKPNSDQLWSPNLDFSVGYSKLNIGDPVSYGYSQESRNLPRTARLGYAVSAGLEWNFSGIWYEVFTAEYSLDALDLLIVYDPDPRIQTGMLGDIDISRNVIKGVADENVDVHKGYRFQFFETFQIFGGGWDGAGWNNPKTSGYAFNLKGLFKLMASDSQDSFLQYLGKHFDFQYVYSETDSGGRSSPDRNGVPQYLNYLSRL